MDGTDVTNDAHQIAETLERKALGELFVSAPESVRDALRFVQVDVAGALVSVVPGASIVLNRTMGLGVREPATKSAIAAIRARYEDAGVGRYFIQVKPGAQPPDLGGWLREAGFVPARRWMKFARPADRPVPRVETSLRIEEIGPDHAAAFGAVIAEGFDLGARGGALPANLVGRSGWHCFMSFDGEEPAGAGALLVDPDSRCGWLDWGATWHAHRGRGGQSAVLAARIEAAAALGCRTLFTATGEWVEGDPQHSYNNIERMGFAPVYLQENYEPAR